MPAETVGLAGPICSDTGTGAFTVRTAAPVAEPELAEMLVVPASMLIASPVELTVATLGFEDVQVANCVMSCVEPSL